MHVVRPKGPVALAVALSIGLSVTLLAPVTATAGAAASTAAPKTVWLCLPGHKPDPCTPKLTTTRESSTNTALGVQKITPVTSPKIDCFYVYPTVSDQKTPQANLDIDPEERSIALFQASYYSRYCRVFAPIYRQLTLSGIGAVSSTPSTTQAGTTRAATNPNAGYDDVLAAWKTYLAKDNHGRGVVFIGHSQGSFVLEQLLSRQVDNKPSVRKLLVSAIILGGNVTVKKGQAVGGTFAHIPACRSTAQLGCVVAYSTFDAPVPTDSLFGRTTKAGLEVLCTNPAALGGGSAPLDAVYPTAPFAPGTTIGAATALLGIRPAPVSTTWVEYGDAYRGKCTSTGGADVLQIQALNGAPTIHAVPTAEWGLHLVDAQITLGNLVKMVGIEAARYFKKTGR
jgi:hypothetical protein